MKTELVKVAERINWYVRPEEVLANETLFLNQVMARGHADDVVTVRKYYPQEKLKAAYLKAPAGLFSKRAWAYWGLVLLGNHQHPYPHRFKDMADFDWRRSEFATHTERDTR